jgi:hypothetical protein
MLRDLAKFIDFGGLCLGLLEPVGNIIVNTISLLPQASRPTLASRSRRHAATRGAGIQNIIKGYAEFFYVHYIFEINDYIFILILMMYEDIYV